MKRTCLIIIVLVSIMAFVSCKKDPAINIQKIELTKENVTEKPKSVTINGTFSYPGTIDSIKIFAADNEYLFNLDEYLTALSGKNFTATLAGLEPASTYYYYYSVYYGSWEPFETEVKNFKTADSKIPEVNTVKVNSVSFDSAICSGEVTDDGGADVTSRGFCWSKTANPTVQNAHIEISGTTGAFEGSLTGLEADETYYVRAYATNNKGIGYGVELIFTTTEGLPIVTTSSVTDITATSAKCGGNVTDQGASGVTERGICWSTNHNPTLADNHISGGSGTGT